MRVIRTNPSARSMAGALRHSKSHRKLAEERRPLMFMGTRIVFAPSFVIPERPVSREVKYS